MTLRNLNLVSSKDNYVNHLIYIAGSKLTKSRSFKCKWSKFWIFVTLLCAILNSTKWCTFCRPSISEIWLSLNIGKGNLHVINEKLIIRDETGRWLFVYGYNLRLK